MLHVIMFENQVLTGFDAFADPIWAHIREYTMTPVVTMDYHHILSRLQQDGCHETASAVSLDEFAERHSMESDYYEEWLYRGMKK